MYKRQLQLKAETKTSKHGLYALLAYTYSHTMDNLSLIHILSGALDKSSTTILKDNISWHYPFPGANTRCV